ncbi:MAG: hypothetical protein LBK99_14515, partial [Opitutaceae bacterium]|nr:hypothetical protein [Opitutaceae bacterium]
MKNRRRPFQLPLLPALLSCAPWLIIPAAATSPVQAWLFVDGKLYAAARLDSPDADLPEKMSSLARGRNATLQLLPIPYPAKEKIISKPLSLPAERGREGGGEGGETEPPPLPKPMNHGVFVDAGGQAHPWHMNHEYEYIFDGAPYFPTGGMWCPDTLRKNTGETNVDERMKKDAATLDALLAHGIDDVYLNLSERAPAWVKQRFVDMLESRKIHYGYQLNGSGRSTIPAFFITRDPDADAPRNYRPLAKGRYAGGKITARFPLEQKVLGLLVIDPSSPARGARYVDFTDKVGQDQRNAVIDFEVEADFGKLREVVFPIHLDLPEQADVVLIPLLDARLGHANLWDPGVFSEIKQKLSWIGQIRWGPHLRFFVDPVSNEGNMVNATENLRQYTPAINAAFAYWLEKRYGTISRLRAEWTVAVEDFAQAARLIPLRLGQTIWWIDPVEGKTFAGDMEKSFAWIDYQAMIRETCSDGMDEIAAYLKSLVNVPVIYKSVGVIGEKMHISRRYLGYDGIGFETYLNQSPGGGGGPGATAGGAARAEAEVSAHTMWKVGTEIGHSAKPGNGDVKFFKDEAQLRDFVGKLTRLGVRGFYFFGIDLKPPRLLKNHNFHDFPEGLEWVARIDREFAGAANPPEATLRNYVFPGGFSYWWWITRYKALYDHEANPIPRSARLGRTSTVWFGNTNVLPETFDAVIISCPKPPFSRYYASDIGRAVRSGQCVYYVGERSDIGIIPEVDRFFTEEQVTFADGSKAQVLRPREGAVVLGEMNGKPWALRTGNLVIVSRVPGKLPQASADPFLQYLAPLVRDGKITPVSKQ